THDLVRCRTADLAVSATPDAAASLESTRYGWLRNARQCDVGGYSFLTPARSDHQAILLLRRGGVPRTLLAATTDAASVFDPDGKRVPRPCDASGVQRDHGVQCGRNGRGADAAGRIDYSHRPGQQARHRQS